MGEIEILREAGFDRDEIDDHVRGTAGVLTQAGFSRADIEGHFGIPPFNQVAVDQAVNELMSNVAKWQEKESGKETKISAEPKKKTDFRTGVSERGPLWEPMLKMFKASAKDDAVRDIETMIAAEKTGLSPSTFQPSKQNLFKTGFDDSASGVIYNMKLPAEVVPQGYEYLLPTTQRLTMQAGRMVGDLPFMVAGGVLGSPGGPVTIAGGAFGLPLAIRKVYADRIQHGEIQSFEEFWPRLAGAVNELAKGWDTGVATRGAGKMAPGLTKLPAEIAAMTYVGAGLEGRIPDAQELWDGAIMLGGLKLAKPIRAKLFGIYESTGARPKDVYDAMARQPQLADWLLSKNEMPHDFLMEALYERGFKVPKRETVDVPRRFSNTQDALAFGKDMLPEQYKKIKALREESIKKQEAMDPKDLQARMDEAVNGQFFREAMEAYDKAKGPQKLFRGTTDTARDERTVKGVISTSANIEAAKIFSGKEGKVQEFILDPKAKIIKVEDITKELSKTKELSAITPRDWINYARENGFDAIDMKSLKLKIQSRTNPNLKGFEDEVKILNTKVLKPLDVLKGETAKKFEPGKKYHQKISEISEVPVAKLKPMDAGEVSTVSMNVAKKMKFDKPVKVSIFKGGEMRIVDGHHRVAAAKRLGHNTINAEVQAINAKGKDLNKLLEILKDEKGEIKFESREYKNMTQAEKDIFEQISVGGKYKERMTWKDLYTYAVDDLYPLKRIVNVLKEKDPLAEGDDPYIKARLLRGSAGIGHHFMEFGALDFTTKNVVGPGLNQILKPLKKELNRFKVYIAAKRAVELHGRGVESGMNVEAARIAAERGDINPRYFEAFEQLKKFQDQSLQYLRDSGLLSPEAYAKMKQANKEYVPFYRVMDSPGFFSGPGKGLEARQPVKKIKGSKRMIVDPLESIIKNAYLYAELAERNAVGTSLISLASKLNKAETGPKGAGLIERVKAPMRKIQLSEAEKQIVVQELGVAVPSEAIEIFRPSGFVPSEGHISVWKDGKRQIFKVHDDIARTFKALDKEQMNIIVKILSKPASWLRAGAILSPEFIARNPIRDQFSAFVYSKYNFIPGYDLAKGVFSLVGRDRYYQEWIKSGGLNAMLVSMDRQHLQKRVKDITGGKGAKVRNLITHPVEALRILSELSEAGTRLGEFRKGRKKGATLAEAGFASREVTLDFGRIGAKTKAVNGIIAFWNAQVQGADKMARAFKNNPVRTSLKTAAMITTPSVLLMLANRDDPRWKHIPDWQKDLFWIVMTDDTIYRIPKPFELGIIFGSVPERALEAALENDPDGWKKVKELLGSLARGAAPGVIPTAALPLLENWANRSLFTDRAIVPADREKWLPAFQSKEYTTQLAKEIGQFLGRSPLLEDSKNISPARLENIVRGWTGGLGMHVLKMSSWAGEKTGFLPELPYERPAKTMADWPAIKAFIVRYPGADAQPIQDYLDGYDKWMRVFTTAKGLGKEGDIDKMIELMTSQEQQVLEPYQAIMAQFKFIRNVRRNPVFDPEDKRMLIDQAYLQMIMAAENGLEILKTIRGD